MEAAPVPTRPAPVATVGQRVEGRAAVVDHIRHPAPDILAGLGLVLHDMTILPPPALGHVPGALRDDCLQGGETRNYPHQGRETIDDHLQRGAMRDDHLQGRVMSHDHHQGGVMSGDHHHGEVMRDDRHQGGVIREDHHQGRVMRQDLH